MLRNLEEFVSQKLWYKARQEADRLLRLPRTLLGEQGYLDVLLAGGKARYGEGDFVGAASFFERALQESFVQKGTESMGTCQVALGACYIQTGELFAAQEHLKAYLLSLPRYRIAAKWEGHVRYNLGLICRRTGQVDEGIENYRAAITFYEERGLYREVGDCQQSLAWLHLMNGHSEEAYPYLQSAEARTEHLDPEYRTEMLCCWAMYFRTLRHVDKATSITEEILVGNQPGLLPRHYALAAWISSDVAFMLDRFEEAKWLASLAVEKAEESRDPELIRLTLGLAARVDHVQSNEGEAAN
jgi:tetratricopeptide (TPR) repeat protein